MPAPELSAYLLEQPSLPRYRDWEWASVAPHLGRSVLEVGAGAGAFTEKLVAAGFDRLVLGDPEPYFRAKLEETYRGRGNVEVVELRLPGRPEIGSPVDSVVAMNVLEHIDDDVGALRDLATVVRPGGNVVLWVPGYMQLYGEFDRKLGHVRRYTPASVRAAVEGAGLRVRLARPINLLGGIAWWATVRQGGVHQPNPKLAAVYDAMVVPASRALERVVRPPFGQSVLCVADVPR